MTSGSLKILSGILLVCLLFVPAMAISQDEIQFDDLGQRAAILAMEKLNFKYGDSDVVVLTNAGRAVITGQTSQKALSGITKITGLQHGDGTMYQINRPNWEPLWFYFYDKESGKALYLEPDTAFYSMCKSQAKKLHNGDAFSKVALLTGDITMMLSDTEAGNATQKALGKNAFSLVSLANVWAHGAPYDLMYTASLHNHFCPGVSSGYLILKYIEKEMPLTPDTSYVVISAPTWCKEDLYPTLWDMTPGKGGITTPNALSTEVVATLTEKYGTRPAGIFVLWNAKEKTGKGMAVGFQFDAREWTGPAWGDKVSQTVDMVENLDHPGDYVTVMKTFTVNEKMLAELKNPAKNPYKTVGMM